MGYFSLMSRILPILALALCGMQAQNTSFPLESVSVEGTALSKEVVMDLAGLRTGTAVDKAAFDAASQKLNDTGLFESINYSYGPAPKRGYVLTLKTVD